MEDKDECLASVEILNSRTRLWTLSPVMINSRSRHASVMVDGYIYILGGNDAGYTNRYERWNTTSNTSKAWTKIPNMPYKAEGCDAVAKDQIVYVIGEYNNGYKYSDTVVVLDIKQKAGQNSIQ